MAEIGIFVGTVYGNALLVAEEAKQALTQVRNHQVKIFDNATIKDWQHYIDKVALVVTSTTGQGDLPDSIAPLFYGIQDQLYYQPSLYYGIIALGDSSYANFCEAGKKFTELLQRQCAQRIGEMLTIDAMENPEPEEVTLPWVEQWAKLIP